MARPAVVDDELVASIVAIYVQAEERLIALMAAKTRQGLAAPDWAEKRLTIVAEYRRQAERIMAGASDDVAVAVDQAVRLQHRRGHVDAVGELSNAMKIDTTEVGGHVDTYAVSSLAVEAQQLAQAPAYGMATAATAQMQAITLDALGPVVTGAATRRQMAQTALDRFARDGITGFTDRAGRRWRADTYVEMAMRTQLRDARIAGHTARLQQYGHDLVIVSAHKHGCELCAPFEGAVLSLSGTVVGAISAPNVLTGEPMAVHVKCSIDEARIQGLWHPHCSHFYSAFQPGVTDPMAFGEKTDPQAYIDRQALRKLERDIRAAKRREAAALDPAALREAKTRTRAISAKIKAHTEQTGITRRRYRETLNAR